ncbi:hypothetical protein SARC_14145, partial [Sphaeroforma arctica JP610]
MAERERILKESLCQDFFMTLQSRMLPAMRADFDWLVAYARLYAGVWPRVSKGDKAAVTANYAKSLRQDRERLFEVLQELIVFMCGRAILTVLISEVEAQGENSDEPVTSAAEYISAMILQKRAPVVDLNGSKDPQPSMGRVGDLAKAAGASTKDKGPQVGGGKEEGSLLCGEEGRSRATPRARVACPASLGVSRP